jgi:hemerythrin-like domain-containing protein
MATKTQPKQKTVHDDGTRQDGHRSPFDWGDTSSGMLLGAAVAGAAVGLAANAGRKLFVQATSGAAGDWADALAAEHKMTLAIFDKIEATKDGQTMARSHLLTKLKHALTKHAIEEEMVVYPALRQAGKIQEAEDFTSEHGIVKTYLYELETTSNAGPEWLARVRDFRSMIQEHMREEESAVFPALRAQLSQEQNRKLTMMMNKEGFTYA